MAERGETRACGVPEPHADHLWLAPSSSYPIACPGVQHAAGDDPMLTWYIDTAEERLGVMKRYEAGIDAALKRMAQAQGSLGIDGFWNHTKQAQKILQDLRRR